MFIDKPRFDIVESWDNSGDVHIMFYDSVTPALKEHMNNELIKMIPYLSKEERSPYHLEILVNGIFSNIKL